MYITRTQLAELPGVKELAQVATSDYQSVVDPELLDAALRDAATGVIDPAAVDALQQAVRRIDQAIADAAEVVDSHIGKRLPTPWAWPSPRLTIVARALVRYDLHRHLIAESKDNPIVRDYERALSMLEDVRDGKITLGPNDPLDANYAAAASAPGLAQVSAPGRVFTDDSLADFGGGL